MNEAMMSSILNVADEVISHFRDPSITSGLPIEVASLIKSSLESKANKLSSRRTLAEHAMLIYKSANLVHDDDVHYHRVADYIYGVIVNLELERDESNTEGGKKRLIKRISTVSELLTGLYETYAIYNAHKAYNI